MRILIAEVHRLTTYSTYGLGLQDLEAGGFESSPGSFLSVCSHN